MFSIMLPAHLEPCRMRIMLKVISVLVITMMVAKGHGNLLTCHNKVPATFDINYERPVASQLEKTVLFKQLRYTLFIPSRDILCFLFACCLQMLEEQQHVACIQEVIFYFSVFVYFFIYMVHLIGFFFLLLLHLLNYTFAPDVLKINVWLQNHLQTKCDVFPFLSCEN